MHFPLFAPAVTDPQGQDIFLEIQLSEINEHGGLYGACLSNGWTIKKYLPSE